MRIVLRVCYRYNAPNLIASGVRSSCGTLLVANIAELNTVRQTMQSSVFHHFFHTVMPWQACILSTWCFCNLISNQLVMHCPRYPPKVDMESRSASRIFLRNREWNISSPQAELTVTSSSRARRSTRGMRYYLLYIQIVCNMLGLLHSDSLEYDWTLVCIQHFNNRKPQSIRNVHIHYSVRFQRTYS